MHPGPKYAMLVTGLLVGGVLFLFGMAAIGFDDREGWIYLLGSLLVFALVLAFGLRSGVRGKHRSPDA